MNPSRPIPRAALLGLLASLCLTLVGCSSFQPRQGRTLDRIDAELGKDNAERKPPKVPDALSQALMPPVVVEAPTVDTKPLEPRFDLNVANAPAAQVLMAIVQGTPFSMVVHPAIKDVISISLRDTTVVEALETVRDLYGYDYRITGKRILVQPAEIQTRVFQVNYLMSQRRGRSDVRVTSGAISDFNQPGAGMPGSAVPGMAPTAGVPGAPGSATNASSQAVVGSRVVTTTDSDFWRELSEALKAIVGAEGGRHVVVSPQSGVIVVRGMPTDLRAVESYLRATRLVLERQVMLEAKIIEVELSDGYQAGVNWGAFRAGGNSRFGAGVVAPGTTLTNQGDLSSPTSRAADGSVATNSTLTATPGNPGTLTTGVGLPGTVFGLALQTGNFASLLSFLETQGNLQVLSSPRIAALNNQKAVLKVGNDEFFVTNITTTTLTSAAGGSTQSPSIVVQPFFSGVALDVTPQIDENDQIILHVHPSVSSVVEKTKNIDLGTSGNFKLPLASSTISETDTIVRVEDGNIVAIGGLMRETTQKTKSGVPGLSNAPIVGAAFRSSATAARKSELVILIKPTVLHTGESGTTALEELRKRLRSYESTDGAGTQPAAPAKR
ncbi:MAG: pilus (MSHA type) biogenesis protein MshL [Burkholderiales bacterium]